MKRKIASTGPSKNFWSQIETPYVSSYMAYAIWELVPTWLRVPIWSGTRSQSISKMAASIPGNEVEKMKQVQLSDVSTELGEQARHSNRSVSTQGVHSQQLLKGMLVEKSLKKGKI